MKNGNILKYAYIVENKWKKRVGKGSKKGARQKVKGYLGRVLKVSPKQEIDFVSHFCADGVEGYIESNDKKSIVMDLVRLELLRHGFEEAGKLLSNGDVFFDLDNNEFSKKVVLEMNEGFMCKETIENLLSFKAKSGEEAGLSLANAFVESGLKVPEEVFVGFFGKLYK